MDKREDMLRFLISKAPLSQKYALLRNVHEQQAKMLSEIVVNVLYCVLPISRYYKRKLQPFKKVWNTLAITSDSERKKIIGNHCESVVLLLKACCKVIRKLIENGVSKNDTDSFGEV